MGQTIYDIYRAFIDPSLVIAPAYLAIAVGVAAMVYRMRHMRGGFWRWLLPAKIYLHPSHIIDAQLFIIARGMTVIGLLGKVTMTTAMAGYAAGMVQAPLIAPQHLPPALLAVVLWLPTDFANYWTHRIFHNTSRLWPLHAVHHSAEVLTPLTTYRQHPLGTLIAIVVQTLVIGTVQGLLVGSLSPAATVAEIAGINACVVLANAALAALHHSHVWLSYGPLLEHVLISPAQHQIHHSVLPAHYDKNFGNTLAVWDWLFGTLYVIRGPEDVTFGLQGDAEQPLMSQRLLPILWDPIRRAFGPRGN